jgi:uncharacterized peroxidase-related enzyme
MPRLAPLPASHTPELKGHFDFFLTTLGFTPNSVLTMQRKPKLVRAFAELNAAVMDPSGLVDVGLKRLIGHIASHVAGCQYCQAHTLLGAHNKGVPDDKLAAVWNYATSPLFSARERAALDFALGAAQQPNAVTDEVWTELRQHWSEDEVVEILAVIAMFAFLNRWNDTMQTPLEAPAIAVADKAIGSQGWTPGHHAA